MNLSIHVSQRESTVGGAGQQKWLCPSSFCANNVLWVRKRTGPSDLWEIIDADGATWLVAASKPVCPRCGTTMLMHFRQS